MIQKLFFILTVFFAIDANAQLIDKELKSSVSPIVEEKKVIDTPVHFFCHPLSSNYNLKEPLLIVNGKRKPYGSISSMDADSIESVMVLQPEEAKKKYGRKAKAGAIIIITKQT